MVGHYFDNLYLYIKSLPTEHSTDDTNSIAKNILQQMLQSFGWKLDASLELLNISDNFLDTQLTGNTVFSADERTRQVWNRILNTLPLIYKTKGTSECIRLVLSCYGIPSTLINIKEYGGIDYTNVDKTSYTIDEKVFMLNFKGCNDYIKIPYDSTVRTVEFKISLDTSKKYEVNENIPLVVKYNQSDELDWTIGVYKDSKQNMGKVYFDIFSPTYVRILSDSIPIFNDEIFNIMVRRNEPDDLFEYNSNSDLVPTKYDLYVERKTDSRIIFNSYKSSILTKDYNYTFSDTGFLYFGNYDVSNGFVGLLDKILLWDSSVEDSTFDDHCNNINSYSYTGSFIPHETLYFRMNFDYPYDLSITSPTTIVNSNEYYSSSISASAYNFPVIAYSSSLDNCVYVSHSAYPYQFDEISYNQTFTINSYGPNKFSNEKVQTVGLNLITRLDAYDTSTEFTNTFVSPDSNQIGLFADPNEYKNKDIFRYLGNAGIVESIADPSQMFDDKYQPLKNIREVYNSSGNKKVLYNEMFTLYKFYFDKSIFETIKQLIPVRNNVLSGILIEPTVLERPKYQYKKLNSEVGIMEFTSSNVSSPITSSNTIPSSVLSMNGSVYCGGTTTADCISANFNLPAEQLYENIPFFLPEGPYTDTDPLYQRYLQLKNQLVLVDSGWIKRYPLPGEFGNVEQHTDWPIPAPDVNILGIFGELGETEPMPGYYLSENGYYYLKNCNFYLYTNESAKTVSDALQKNINTTIDLSNASLLNTIYPTSINNGIIKDIENSEELGIQCDSTGKVLETVFSGSLTRYLLKNWNKNYTYVTTGDYSKPQTVSSQSIYLYNTEAWNAPFFLDHVYTSSIDFSIAGYSKYSYIDGYSPDSQNTPDYIIYHHDANTFKQNPNSKTNNVYQSSSRKGKTDDFDITTIKINHDQYYETMGGYPRNHLTHKRLIFSNESWPYSIGKDTFDRYIKSRQTIDTTVDLSGLTDNSLPIQSINVSNINVVQTENVLDK